MLICPVFKFQSDVFYQNKPNRHSKFAGFTVALDKRLAADGRGLQQVHINENFAKFSEALYIADRKARESVELRSQLEKRQALKKKEEQEEKMKEMARAAREERQNIRRTGEFDDLWLDVAGVSWLRYMSLKFDLMILSWYRS